MNGGGITTVAVLGAGGTMGKGIARNLAAGAGIAVRAWNRSRERLDELAGEDDLVVCERAEEAVAGADVILTMLSDGEAVLATLEAAAPAAVPEAVWLQQSTIGIEATERCAELARRHGLDLVDAPVLGTKQPAEAGELVILASGPEPLRMRLEPLFDAIGKRTLWVGEAGAGSRCGARRRGPRRHLPALGSGFRRSGYVEIAIEIARAARPGPQRLFTGFARFPLGLYDQPPPRRRGVRTGRLRFMREEEWRCPREA